MMRWFLLLYPGRMIDSIPSGLGDIYCDIVRSEGVRSQCIRMVWYLLSITPSNGNGRIHVVRKKCHLYFNPDGRKSFRYSGTDKALYSARMAVSLLSFCLASVKSEGASGQGQLNIHTYGWSDRTQSIQMSDTPSFFPGSMQSNPEEWSSTIIPFRQGVNGGHISRNNWMVLCLPDGKWPVIPSGWRYI